MQRVAAPCGVTIALRRRRSSCVVEQPCAPSVAPHAPATGRGPSRRCAPHACASQARGDLGAAVTKRDASMYAVLSSLTAAVEDLTKVVEVQRIETAASLASLESRLCATTGDAVQAPTPAAAQPVAQEAASDLAAALARAEDEVSSLRQGNAALQAALEHASKLMTTVRQEASDARKAREEESLVIAEELQSAHRATAEAVAEAASLRAEIMRLEAALEAAAQQGGGVVPAMEDPPVEAVPVPVAVRAAPPVGAVASDLNAALVAARARAQAAEENLHAARDAATAMVANAPQWNRYSGAAAL